MTVQRLHANDAYTFAPYNAYFNDYYTPDGDGAIAGQTVQDDMFYYFRANRQRNCWRPVTMMTRGCWTVWKAPTPHMFVRAAWMCPTVPGTMP